MADGDVREILCCLSSDRPLKDVSCSVWTFTSVSPYHHPPCIDRDARSLRLVAYRSGGRKQAFSLELVTAAEKSALLVLSFARLMTRRRLGPAHKETDV